MNPRFLLTGTAAIGALIVANANVVKPNVIVILADDIGWGDVGCNGAKLINTPNIDALARNGVNFSNGYAPASTSTPTRFSLLTGEYAFRKGLNILPGDAPMAVGTDNLASYLKQHGYSTAVVGKWHLGLGSGNLNFNRHINPSPNDIGFDYSFIIPGTGDRTPCVFVENGWVVNHDVERGDVPIEVSYEHKVGSDPTGAENPEMQKLCTIKDNHSMTIVNGVARMGWMTGGYRARWVDEETSDLLATKTKKVIKERGDKPFFIYLATHDAHEPRIANARFRGSSGCGIYGDVVQQFDDCVGQVVKALKDEGVFENTIIIISSDNGPMITEAYDDGAAENLNGHDPYAGMRGDKYTIYQGGLRVPFLMSWPAMVKKGRTENRPVCLSNLMPTIASLTRNPIDSSMFKDAQDDSGIYLNKKNINENPVYLQRGDGRALAVVYKKWKYIKYTKGAQELYYLPDDISESKNLIESQPAELSELKALLEAFQKRK